MGRFLHVKYFRKNVPSDVWLGPENAIEILFFSAHKTKKTWKDLKELLKRFSETLTKDRLALILYNTISLLHIFHKQKPQNLVQQYVNISTF